MGCSGVTAQLASIPSARFPDDPSTFDVTFTATPQASTRSCNLYFQWVFDGVSYPVTQYDAVDIYDSPPYIFSGRTGKVVGIHEEATYPGGPFYIEIYGTNFGPAPGGGLFICAPTVNPCTSGNTTSDFTSVQITGWQQNVGGWGYDQVNALLTPGPNAVGPYAVVLKSLGGNGLAFAFSPQQTNSANYSNRGFVTVAGSQVSLTLNRQSLMQINASGTPAGGSYSTNYIYTRPFTGTGVQLAPGSQDSSVIALQDPANPAPNGAPSPGNLVELGVYYTATSGGTALDTFYVPTFGMSCYFTASESDYWNGQQCTSITIQGKTYSGIVTNPPGLTGTFCNAFLAEVRLQGSGVTRGGQPVAYIGNGPFALAPVKTADGSPPIAGQTVARDRSIVPRGGVQVALDTIGSVIANDVGGAITGYRLDLYKGIGGSVSLNYASPILVGACLPGNALCPTADVQ